MIEEMNNIPKEDDGSLAFLNIPRDENSRSFNDTIKTRKHHVLGG